MDKDDTSRMPHSSRPSSESSEEAVTGDLSPRDHEPAASDRMESTAASPVPSPEPLGSRLLRPQTLLSFVIAVAIFIFLFTRLEIDIGEVVQSIRDARLIFLVPAFALFYGALFLRTLRWKAMLAQADISKRHGYQLPASLGLYRIILLSWFANSIAPARLGDAYRAILLKQRSGASIGTTVGTILAERLIDLIVLVVVLLMAGLIVFGTHVPDRAGLAFLFGAAVVVVGVLGVLVLWFGRTFFERLVPNRFVSLYQRLQTGVFKILRRPWPFAGVSVVIWFTDGLRLLLVARSLGVELTIQAAIMVALISALVTIIPFTPAGLGIVEGFMIWALTQVGVMSSAAVAIALLDRSITYLSLIVIGVLLYLLTLRREVVRSEPAPNVAFDSAKKDPSS